MRFLILGAGGIGAYYGARLLSAGHAVVFAARGTHLKALQNRGLRVTHPSFSYTGAVTAFDPAQLQSRYTADDFDLIVLTLKAGATVGVLHSLSEWLRASPVPLLSLQNGVDNEQAIEAGVGRERTIGGLAVRIGGHIVEPGCIEATGPAQVVMGAWPTAGENRAVQEKLPPFAECFNQAGIPAMITANIRYELWRKLLINNGVNPLSALTGLDTRSLTAHPVYTRTVYALMQEAALAAQADGVNLTEGDVNEMYRLISQFDAIKTSMLVDRERGRPLELDEISGAVIRRCERLGKSVPLTELVCALLEQFVSRERESSVRFQ